MVRITKVEYTGKGPAEPAYKEFAGLSTDAKPTEGIMTGSLFLEVDTGDVYAYNETGTEWNQIASLGG